MNRYFRDRRYEQAQNVYIPRAWQPRKGLFKKVANVVREFFWVGLMAITGLLVISLITHAAFAAGRPSRHPGALYTVSCGDARYPELRQIEYVADFTWDGRPLRVELGMPREAQVSRRGKPTLPVARFLALDPKTRTARCVATCEAERFDQDPIQGEPLAMDLRCSASGIGALSGVASLVWKAEAKAPAPAAELRFGSWVEGYRSTQLKVLLDAYRHPRTRLAAGR